MVYIYTHIDRYNYLHAYPKTDGCNYIFLIALLIIVISMYNLLLIINVTMYFASPVRAEGLVKYELRGTQLG